MANFRSHFQRLLFPGLAEVARKQFEEFEPLFSKIFNVKDSDKPFEESLSVAGPGLFIHTPEGIDHAEDEFTKGFGKRWTHEEYTKGMGFTDKAVRDINQVKLANERVGELGYSSRQTQEIMFHDMLNSGTTGTGPDGVPLFSALHPNIKGGTQSNIISPVGTLSIPTIRAARTASRRMFDHTGVRRLNVPLKWLVVPPEEEDNAMELIKSSGRPDTANRADNTLKGYLDVIVDPYLTDTNNVFFMVDAARHRLRVWIRTRFKTRTYFTDRNKMNWVVAEFEVSYGHSDYLGVWILNPS